MGKGRRLCRGIGDTRAVEQTAGCFVRSRSGVNSPRRHGRATPVNAKQLPRVKRQAPIDDGEEWGHLRPIGGRIDRRQLPRRTNTRWLAWSASVPAWRRG